MISLALVSALATSQLDLTLEEFKMYQQYRNAMEDPRVQAMKPEKRLLAIAKDAGFKMKDLQRAIQKGEAAGDIKAVCEAQLREALGKTSLGERIGRVEVDTSDPHAVAYVQWLNEDPNQLEEEASIAAATACSACPIVSTVQVWAQSKANPDQRVFQALISNSAAQKINLARVKDFADTRYIRLFEKVKSIAAGDDLSAESGTPAGKASN